MSSECPDAVVQRVLMVVQQQFQQRKFKELIPVLSQALKYIESLDQGSIKTIRSYYRMSENKKNESIHPKLTTILDYRATVYEKLGSSDKAILDTRNIIDIEPYNPKGYIRLVKLYKPINVQRAYEVGCAGIRKVNKGIDKYKLKVNERNYEILRNLTIETSTIIKKRKHELELKEIEENRIKKLKLIEQSKVLDPFELLPFEVLELILLNFSIPEVLKLLAISKKWYSSISKMSLFNTVNMRYQTSIKDLSNCFKLINKDVLNLSLKSIRRFDESKIMKFLLSSKHKVLNSLEINLIELDLKSVIKELEKSKNLNQLRNLSISCIFDNNYEYELLSTLKNLKILSINVTSIKPSLLAMKYNPRIFSNLITLQIISNNNGLPFQKLFEFDEEVYPNLRILIIKNCNFNKINLINQHHNFLNKFPNLNKLIFENNLNFSFPEILTNINVLKNLQFFQLNEQKCGKYNLLTNFINNQEILNNNIEFIFKNLIILNLSHSSIQFNSLIKILKISNLIQKLSLGQCPNLQFKSSLLDLNNPNLFDFKEFISNTPSLKTLLLNESVNFNDFALNQLITALKTSNGLLNLRNLDLSYNLDLSGYKLLEFVKLRSLDNLVLNGIDIKLETIKLMEYKYVGKVECKMNIPIGYKPLLF